ncbi:rab3 GTPase-activating protein catalytic subunit [Trichonephila clavipes]|nr:rab3 GTPase-activating protein catalytic subunit [Trichonephila clavipes]
MMSRENDFPPKAHCLVRWYGLREFVVIHPAKANDAIMTEDRTKMLLSSVTIAVNNTSCQVPVFVQLQQMRQKYYLGVCEGGGVRTSFDMIHLHRPFPQLQHMQGLLQLFKGKMSLSTVPPVTVSIRFTYVLQDWSPCSWPQPPPGRTSWVSIWCSAAVGSFSKLVKVPMIKSAVRPSLINDDLVELMENRRASWSSTDISATVSQRQRRVPGQNRHRAMRLGFHTSPQKPSSSQCIGGIVDLRSGRNSNRRCLYGK